MLMPMQKWGLREGAVCARIYGPPEIASLIFASFCTGLPQFSPTAASEDPGSPTPSIPSHTIIENAHCQGEGKAQEGSGPVA